MSAEGFYFAENRLFGMYHAPHPESMPKQHLVVFCGAILHEYYKTQFVSRQLSLALSQLGYDVLRFDYSGQGNSAGEISLTQWQNDLDSTIDEGLSLSGADRVSLFGVRFGCLICSHYAGPHPVEKFAMWDPIAAGDTYLKELKTVQSGLVGAHRCLSEDERSRAMAEELVGFRVDNGFVSELDALSFDYSSLSDALIVRSESRYDEEVQSDSGAISRIDVPFACQWDHHNSRLLYAHEVVSAISGFFE